ELAGLELFRLPADSSGKPTLIEDWSVVPAAGGKYSINFESSVNGPQVYAFGKVQGAAGSVSQSDDQPPIYDFNVARDSASYSIPVKFKGTGFKTTNPLLLI